ncbi:MAG: CvpA family protein, partial [Clostridia bacterium]|nr:CvpA family protein [Clostridia bacterium]
IFEIVGDRKLFSLRALKGHWQFFVIVGIAVIAALTGLASFVSAEIFNASAYRDMITISDGDFAEDIAELSMDQIPVVDRDTASRLGQRQLGDIPDLVSQFEISEDYTQINVGERPMRVTPLVYADFFKWMGNQSEGIPAYITVDMVTQDTALYRLPAGQGMKYSESEYFMRNIDRHLRFSYPTKIFGEVLFEIDDNGAPYWVAPCMHYRIGVWGGMDVKGAVLVNAITGESVYHDIDKIPQWVDRVYDANNVISQLNWNGKYQEGFFNAYFGQRNVRLATEGYSYIAEDDDVYLYTGMTSATADESNIGFVLVNMRTKETKFYKIPGAEEYSAMSSAEGQVQHLGYNATFPLLLNINDRPTYFMSLKDASGLVKMYAFVDVERYHIVGTGDTVKTAQADYVAKQDANTEDKTPPQTTVTFDGTIAAVNSAVVNGSTVYYIRLTEQPYIFTVTIAVSPELPFAAVGDAVRLTTTEPADGQTVCEVSAFAFTADGTTDETPDGAPNGTTESETV